MPPRRRPLKGSCIYRAGSCHLDPNCGTYIDEPLFYRPSLSAPVLIREIFVSDVRVVLNEPEIRNSKYIEIVYHIVQNI